MMFNLLQKKPILVCCLYFRRLREMPKPERNWDLAKAADECIKETTKGETKLALTGEGPQETPVDPDRVDPLLPFKLDSVCPPGCFWPCLVQDESRGLLSVECASVLLFNKAHLERGTSELVKAVLHLDFELDALVLFNTIAVIYRGGNLSMMQTHTFAMHIFFSTRQKKCSFILSMQLVFFVQHMGQIDACTYICMFEQTHAETFRTSLSKGETVVHCRYKRRESVFSCIAPWINSINGLYHQLQSVNYLLSCLLGLLKCCLAFDFFPR